MEQSGQNTVLLVMDMQTALLRMLPDAAACIGRVAEAIAAARDKKMPVIYVTVGFRPGAPEMNVNGKGLAAQGGREKWDTAFAEDWMKIHPDLSPLPGEIIVTKRRISAFSGSDLEIILRTQGLCRLVLTGVSTSGAVLSTVREAADKDYQVTVLSDGCADRDEEVHRVLTTKIFSRQADVMTVEEWTRL